ncbi:hypothetical protein [uncultured Ruminobacter sp.]|uniref:hypothetical protein n=1 Tax=uncultured Ruminobacter sp. TaxID=538947 RepID=UPI0025D70E0A|nr:hypothetical protein [uncultured Ruminobacter sp.]
MQKFLKKLFIFPILAIFSRKFYIPVICYFRGFGQGHLLRSSGLAAVLITIGIAIHFHGFFQNDLLPMAEKVPAFDYSDGRISIPKDGKSDFWQKDDSGSPYVLYHYENGKNLLAVYPERMYFQDEEPPVFEVDEMASNQLLPVVTVYSNSFCFGLNGFENAMCLNYRLLTSSDETTVTVTGLIETFVSKMMVVYSGIVVMVLYFAVLLRQCIMIGITSLLSLFVEIIVKISLPRDALLRLNTYANTLPLAMLVISVFFMDNPQVHHALTNSLTILLPLVYVYLALSDFRSNLIVTVKENMKNNGDNGSVEHIKVNGIEGHGPFDDSFVPGMRSPKNKDGESGENHGAEGTQKEPESSVRSADDGNDDSGVFTP